MTKIINKWYVSMLFLPIILTYLTNYFDLPLIFSNWKNSIITALIIFILILFYELKILKNCLIEIKSKPKENDKKIVGYLIAILNLNTFQEDICEQNAWYGYTKKSISRIIKFTTESKLIKYKTSDKKLNILISNLTEKLDEFQNYSSLRLFGDREWYVPLKHNLENKDKLEIEVTKMNKMTKLAFFELEKLLEYIKIKEYL